MKTYGTIPSRSGSSRFPGRPLAALALAAALAVLGGCTTSDVDLVYDAQHPLIRFSNNGILFRDRFVTPDEAMRLLRQHGVPKDATIHILVDDDFADIRAPAVFQRKYLATAGYTRSILVSPRRAESQAGRGPGFAPGGAQQGGQAPTRQFRYRGADE